MATARVSDRELVAYLERLSGRQIRSRQDITSYVNESSQTAQAMRSRWENLKSGSLYGLLVIAALQYYFIDVQLRILSQPSLTVFVPVKPHSASQPAA